MGQLFEYFKTCFSNRAEGFSYLFIGIVISLGFIMYSTKNIKDPDIIYWLHIISIGYVLINAFLLLLKKRVLISIAPHMLQGFLYVGLPIFLLLRYILDNREGNWVILGIIILIWVSDSAAYFVGSQLGKRKLFESVSPKKTWEGFIGAGVFSIIAAVILSYTTLGLHMNAWIAIGIVTWIIGTIGDLVESSFKRHFKIKDSGGIMPGHGGFLDRFDSFIFSLPLILYYLNYMHG